MIEGYLRSSLQLRGIVQLIDSRHAPTADDQSMLDFLSELGVPTIVVLTKVDKLTATQRKQSLIDITTALGLEGCGQLAADLLKWADAPKVHPTP